MMAYMRASKTGRTRENLALLWLDAHRREVARNPFLQRLLAGIGSRAAALGFGLESFYPAEDGIGMARLSGILAARGIHGVIISPLLHHTEFGMTLRWEHFSTVIIGRGQIGPALHRVAPDHWQGMTCAMRELRRSGYSRIGLCVGGGSFRRQDHLWEGSFLIHHPLGIREAAPLILAEPDITVERFAAWARERHPEVVLFQGVEPERLLAALPLRVSSRPAWASLDTPPDAAARGIAGIDQHYEVTGTNAVDLVAAHILHNERGLPGSPKLVLCEGTWLPGKSAPRRKKQAGQACPANRQTPP
ncbi:hypothetical protein OPIT5_22630 [Opitutaceae bacterium TAV5]|nr:hypothetical protein OPIT5_22630 [Opitutaceae bacterium TAV5]